MIKGFLAILIAVLMLISPELPGLLDLGKKPQGETLDMDKFELVWSDEFNGDSLDMTKWGYSWWITERKGGYWHEDMVSVKDGHLIIKAQYLETPPENKYPLFLQIISNTRYPSPSNSSNLNSYTFDDL